ncbi:Pkinase-domain-containing protein [Parathielavia appendiculata]|uniref:non-specific serine/threonine protein kinase n=1 Tax=Parathielavia appendiculata TaxID=2587402 RepID=A0AAN6U0R9_9PEZI|nr:Pkinase-domain-containing protein [Parathielavia appendiculata]
MLEICGGNPDNGDDTRHDAEARGWRGLSPSLQIPKNRSTGNLGAMGDSSERARIRFSFDAGTAAAEYDAMSRSSIMTDHDHGLGMSGLRRIRQQHNPMRAPTMPSSLSETSSSGPVTRSVSTTMLLEHTLPLSPCPTSPTFTEDLSRFPSESLHSFSFAHQSEDLIHSRQNVLKRSMEFMRDRMAWAASSNAGIASAQARATGDVETQNMLDLLARARLVGAGNLPHGDPSMITGPLTGPATVSDANVFEKGLAPRTSSPEPIDRTPLVSPTAPVPQFAASQIFNSKQDVPVTTSDSRPQPLPGEGIGSENSSRTPTNESGMSGTTAQTSPPTSRRPSVLKRTMTDTDTIQVSVQQKLIDVMAQPFLALDTSPQPHHRSSLPFAPAPNTPAVAAPALLSHPTRWVPAAQAIFTTESKPPWTILAANDLACLLFGVTTAEVRRMGILEVVQEERRAWLVRKLQKGSQDEVGDGPESEIAQPAPAVQTSTLLGARSGGITAKLLSKPNSRSSTPKTGRRPATIHSGDPKPPKPGQSHRTSSKSRGVLLCGDVVPIQKRNGATGSASFWVIEKRVGLIWVLEEIHEDVAHIDVDEDGTVVKLSGALGPIWGNAKLQPGLDVGKLIPRIPRQGIDPRFGEIDYREIAKKKYYTCRNCDRINIPATVEQVRGATQLRVSSFPHIAGIVVVCPDSLAIKSSNSVFCGALFGHERPDGMSINQLVPNFDKVLRILTERDGIHLVEGIVIPEHSFRKAWAFLALEEGQPDAATGLLRPESLPARHRDGSQLRIDIQMRVVKSEKQVTTSSEAVVDNSDDESAAVEGNNKFVVAQTEMVYALWITYSRHLHASRVNQGASSPVISGAATPLHQPSPGQTPAHTPLELPSDSDESQKEESKPSSLARQLKEAAINAAARLTGSQRPSDSHGERQVEAARPAESPETPKKKTIDDFVILEDMGQGAYGQVKLARYRSTGKKCVLKYVTKRRILVDTWTRDRRLGTVPLEIHVLDYLRRDGLRHPNIVEMDDFFEDDVNYYIEMAPHGLPGMDLFDYIELRTNMDEQESRSIFVQVARAIHHLHTKALVVHRDIKDENVILDGEGRIKLIDFGSAAYIKSGPFDVFVDYAAPEVLAGQPYGGKEQDVWALGILLYTIIYKENPFYSIDEIMDRDLRVPYTISDESIDLIRKMLDRDVGRRYTIDQVLAHPWCRME